MEGRGDATMKATGSSWQTKEMPEKRSLLEFKQHFSRAQFERLSLGKVPECMEDKWFIFFEEPCLFFHRSWTGDCIFQLRLRSDEHGYIVAEAWVNRNSQQFNSGGPASEIQLLSKLVRALIN
jgi:hypothetical protein